LLDAALEGKLDDVETYTDQVFGFEVPVSVAGVPNEIMRPSQTWSDPEKYNQQAAKLAELFKKNFQQFTDLAPENVRAAGPR
jgi:phosphoenolpyruvate carboxykinase (ATP)